MNRYGIDQETEKKIAEHAATMSRAGLCSFDYAFDTLCRICAPERVLDLRIGINVPEKDVPKK